MWELLLRHEAEYFPSFSGRRRTFRALTSSPSLSCFCCLSFLDQIKLQIQSLLLLVFGLLTQRKMSWLHFLDFGLFGFTLSASCPPPSVPRDDARPVTLVCLTTARLLLVLQLKPVCKQTCRFPRLQGSVGNELQPCALHGGDEQPDTQPQQGDYCLLSDSGGVCWTSGGDNWCLTACCVQLLFSFLPQCRNILYFCLFKIRISFLCC